MSLLGTKRHPLRRPASCDTVLSDLARLCVFFFLEGGGIKKKKGQSKLVLTGAQIRNNKLQFMGANPPQLSVISLLCIWQSWSVTKELQILRQVVEQLLEVL